MKGAVFYAYRVDGPLPAGRFEWQQARGTYAGVIEKIPYLKELGVTVVELMRTAE